MDAIIAVTRPLLSGPAEGPEGREPSRAPLPRQGDRPPRNFGPAYMLAASVAIGVGLGWLVDRQFGTRPWWTVGLSMGFLVVGMYHVIRASSK